MMRKYFSLLTLILLSFGVYAGGPAPANDDCVNAIVLPVNLSCSYTTATNANATASSGVPAPGCANYSGGDVWFSLTVPASGSITVTGDDAGGFTDGGMAIYSGTCGSLSLISCNDDSGPGLHSEITLTGQTPGATLWIRYWEYGNDVSGNFNVCATQPPPAPSNDLCANATSLSCGTSLTNQSTANTTNTAHGTSCSMSNYGVWYSFVGDGNNTTITVSNSYDIELSISSGSCGAFTNIVCTDSPENHTFTTVNGVTYYVYVAYWTTGTTTGTFDISRTCTAPGSECTPNTTIPSIPYVQTGFNTAGSGDDFSSSDACGSSYMGGDDYVFTYTPSANECVSIALTNTSTWVGVFLTDGCPTTGTCVASNTNSSGNPSISSVNLTAGTTYFITVSTFPSPQTTPFDISITACPPPPSNDECSGAISLTMSTDGSCNSVSSSVTGAYDSGISSACWGTPNDDVWFSFVATDDTAYVDRIADFDSEIEVFDGCSGTSLGCQDSESSILITGLTVGNTYYVRVYSYSSTLPSDGDFTICVFGPAPPPENDLCSKMQPICADSPYSFVATQGGDDASTTEPGNDYDCLSTSPNPTWFFLEIDTGGVMSFDITAADDIDFALWGPYTSLANAKAACGSLPVPIDCSYSSTNIEQANANVSAGDVFILLVTNYADVQQPITLNSSSANTASTDCTILPIELMSFVANASENGNELSWQTLTEINNDYFILETSKDARNFEAIANVDGAGNSNELMNYYFIDNNPIASVTYYRLKQVDFDGKFSYSDVVSVRRIEDGEVVISPNPVKDVLNIELKTTQAGNYNFIVVDLLGAVIEKNIHLNKGTNNIKLDVFADLPQGFYMLKIMDENNTIITTKKIVKN